MKILIDMNLSPEWVDVFNRHDIEAVHWSSVGDPGASDQTIMIWARTRDYVVFTHDLDFGAMLVATQADSPSVIQVRTRDTFPSNLELMLISTLREHESVLHEGALVVVYERRARVRILPLGR